MKDVDGNGAGNEANQTSEQNKPPIVLGNKAIKNAEHITGPIVNAADESA
ncbi:MULTISPECIES: hypothetical protein [unclassified Bradyrhizobium]